MIRHLQRRQFVPGDPTQIWDFFATPRNLDTLTPPTMPFEIVGEVPPRMFAGLMIEYRVGIIFGFKTRWLTEITHVREGEYFVDEQRIGPYKLWHHEHHFASRPDGSGVDMTDQITYDPGWSVIGAIVDALWIRKKLQSIFDYRARKIAERYGGETKDVGSRRG